MESSFCVMSGFARGRGGLRGEDRGVKFLIILQDGLCMFQLPLGYPGVFFS